MPGSNLSDLWVTWDDYHLAIEKLILLVEQSGWQFDQVLCLARGGLRPGDIFSRVFDVPLAILSVSSYREAAGTVRADLCLAQSITMPTGSLSGKVLLVDDLVDSGITLLRVQEHLRHNYPLISEIKSAVIWCKACSSIRPDYYLEYLESNPWIHQPFEEYDSLRPQQIAERHRRK
ncbi:phosphoribosyltransferase [soil metagenome]